MSMRVVGASRLPAIVMCLLSVELKYTIFK